MILDNTVNGHCSLTPLARHPRAATITLTVNTRRPVQQADGQLKYGHLSTCHLLARGDDVIVVSIEMHCSVVVLGSGQWSVL